MITKIISILKGRFFQLSLIVLAGSFLVNIFNYVFNLVMGRMLTPAEYGEVASLMGLAVIIGVPSASLIRLMSKYVAAFKEKGETRFISEMFYLASRYGLLIGLAVLLIFWGLAPLFGWFLKIDIVPLLIFPLIFPFSLILAVNQGTLQGLRKFVPYSLTSFFVAIIKLVLAILLVLLGFSVVGVMVALVIGYIIAYLYGLSQVRPHLKFSQDHNADEVKSEINKREVASYAKTVFITSLLLVLFFNLDVVLAKHYLSPDLAGQYAALSIAGKIIFYASGSFLTVLFPMVSASRANGDGKEKSLLKTAFVLSGGIAGLILILFILAPGLSIKLLFGAKYLSIVAYLAWFSLAIFFCSLSQVFITYFMAVHAKHYLLPFASAVVLQGLLIAFFHANIWQISYSILASNLLLLIALTLVYYNHSFVIQGETKNLT